MPHQKSTFPLADNPTSVSFFSGAVLREILFSYGIKVQTSFLQPRFSPASRSNILDALTQQTTNDNNSLYNFSCLLKKVNKGARTAKYVSFLMEILRLGPLLSAASGLLTIHKGPVY